MTKAWSEDWQKIRFLLMLPELKQVMISEKMNVDNKITYEDLISYTSKLELGVLAFLWCTGTNRQKSSFLFKLVNPSN